MQRALTYVKAQSQVRSQVCSQMSSQVMRSRVKSHAKFSPDILFQIFKKPYVNNHLIVYWKSSVRMFYPANEFQHTS